MKGSNPNNYSGGGWGQTWSNQSLGLKGSFERLGANFISRACPRAASVCCLFRCVLQMKDALRDRSWMPFAGMPAVYCQVSLCSQAIFGAIRPLNNFDSGLPHQFVFLCVM